MIEKVCNLWIEKADYRCIPCSGAVEEGEAVMTSGIALDASKKYPSLPGDLGRVLTSRGNHVHEIRPGMLSFPVRQYEWQAIQIPIVARSANELKEFVGDKKTLLPRPHLTPNDPSWEQIAEALGELPDNIIVVQHK